MRSSARRAIAATSCVSSPADCCARTCARDAGFGESTQDLVFAGHDLIAENGALLSESKMFSQGIIYADIDLQRLAHERQRMNTFRVYRGRRVLVLACAGGKRPC